MRGASYGYAQAGLLRRTLNGVNLSLDPGLAFGTGSHPTTHLCLRWLDQQDLSGKTVIDYGCGSGVLGIAALLLGAKQVIAVDNDPQALLASRDNAQRNNIASDRLITYLPDDVPANLQVDVMIANILAAPLISLAPKLCVMTKSKGLLCLAGLLDRQIESVSAPYSRDFTFSAPAIQSEWAQLTSPERLLFNARKLQINAILTIPAYFLVDHFLINH